MGAGALTALSNFQIQDYYKDCKAFGGTPCNDEMVDIDPKKFYIINMSTRAEGGSHWTLLFQNLYFDSFGCPPTLAVKPFVSVWNDTQYQDFHSSACGFYCIYVADNLLAGRPPTIDLIPDDEETPTRSSEIVLRKYFSENNDRFLQGAGFYQKLVDRAQPRPAETARLRTFLDGPGSQEVTKIEIARKPIYMQKLVTKTMDLLSRGRFSKKKKELGYDDLMHQYTLITLKDGSTWKIEKNHVIEAFPAKQSDYVKDRSNVPLNGTLSLKDMMTNASKDDPKFWRYDARNSNCQGFTRTLLEKNGLTPEHPPLEQDSKALIDTLPLQGVIPNAITDLAAHADHMMYGGTILPDLSRWY